MLETIFNDVANIIDATFLNGDWLALGIAFGSVLIASLLMSRGGQAAQMTLVALVLFAIGGLLRGYLRGPNQEASEVSRLESQLEAGWSRFINMEAGTLLAYFLAFMLLLFVMFGLRGVLRRGGHGGH